MIICIGSKNKVKISAVNEAFQICFPNTKMWFLPNKINSSISSMPMSRKELINGAKERAQLALEKKNEFISNNKHQFDSLIYGVGLEGGMSFEKTIGKWFLEGWVAIIQGNTNYISYGHTAGMVLPELIVENVLSGIELADVIDELTGITNTREKSGAFGILTNNHFSRYESFKEAIILACAPFYQKFQRNSFYGL